MKPARALLLLSLCLISGPSLALRSDRDQPIRVSSDTVDVNQKQGVSKYKGNVILIQGTLRIEADEVQVYFKKNEVERVFASGRPVKFRQRLDGQEQEIEASAHRVKFYALKNRVDLFDDVVFQQGQDTFKSPVVRYDLNSTQLTAEGGNNPQRVHSVVQPRKKPDKGSDSESVKPQDAAPNDTRPAAAEPPAVDAASSP